MKIIYNKIIPFGRRFYAINLCGVLFAKGPCDRRMLNHECIHTAQIKELAYIGFYIWYVLEWLVRLLLRRGDTFRAYHDISFEREAYANEGDYGYLGQRRRYSFLCYLRR
ncbi:MAG: hypothetical protein K2K26_03660 [Muribaculaceae bacterium]|nr:hypothetical protein [Muribaculaceae bacterium]